MHELDACMNTFIDAVVHKDMIVFLFKTMPYIVKPKIYIVHICYMYYMILISY